MSNQITTLLLTTLLTCTLSLTANAIPKPGKADLKSPAKYTVIVEMQNKSLGSFQIDITRKWAPNGADRFYTLVKKDYFKDIALFRAIDGFMVQFGIHGNPAVSKVWREAKIKDDPKATPKVSNDRGFITFATAGPHTRTVQLFINTNNNAFLDSQGFTPFGKVDKKGLQIFDKVFKGYGEKPNQGQIQAQGNNYLSKSFPKLDYIKSIKLK